MHFFSSACQDMFPRSQALGDKTVSFKEAVLRCLPDDGLYVPEALPDLRQLLLHMDENTPFAGLASIVTPLLFEGELSAEASARVTKSAFTFTPVMAEIDENTSVLCLYDGPTGSFKDFGIGFLAALFDELLGQQTEKTMVISSMRESTAGIVHAFHGNRHVVNVLLCPGVNSPGFIRGLDSADFVPNGGNVIPIEVNGTLDDCQRLLSGIIRDRSFAGRYHVTSANAINVGRLLPQTFYYLFSYVMLKRKISGDLFFSIPCGNFGNLIAGLYAWKFGMPVNGFIAAMNANNAFGPYIQAGNAAPFNPSTLVTTNSPALDVGRPSNYERLDSFYRSAPAVMKHMVFPQSVNDNETLAAMRQAWDNYGLIIDPQGAVAFSAAKRMAKESSFEGHIVCLATGHPARWADTVFKATGERLELPEKFAFLAKKAKPIAVIENDLEGLENAIASCL
ncbi:MAG: pyridoxal-phosphate dependent enzyme [Treponema sp.]|jgi:threonine synthase|nr:pyridoxal-phosphate dependent enzyme [Treponema sp.]